MLVKTLVIVFIQIMNVDTSAFWDGENPAMRAHMRVRAERFLDIHRARNTLHDKWERLKALRCLVSCANPQFFQRSAMRAGSCVYPCYRILGAILLNIVPEDYEEDLQERVAGLRNAGYDVLELLECFRETHIKDLETWRSGAVPEDPDGGANLGYLDAVAVVSPDYVDLWKVCPPITTLNSELQNFVGLVVAPELAKQGEYYPGAPAPMREIPHREPGWAGEFRPGIDDPKTFAMDF